MKKFILGFITGGVICATVTGFASNAWQSINVLPNTIKVIVDGKEVQADNFLYNDTTYLPIRAVSEALKMDVQYDNATSTATISSTEPTSSPIPTTVPVNEIPPQATELNPVFSTNVPHENGLTSDGIPIKVSDKGEKYISTLDIDEVYHYEDYGYSFGTSSLYDNNSKEIVLKDIPTASPKNSNPTYEYYETVLRPFFIEHCR